MFTGRRLLDHDPFFGITRWFYYEEETDTAMIEATMDAEPIYEENRRIYNEYTKSSTWKGDFHQVAKIPLVSEPMRSGRIHDEKDIKKWLNDSENRKYRTRPGWL